MGGAVPVPRREDGVVLGQRRGGLLLLLRLPGQGRRDPLRAGDRAPRLRRGGRAAGGPGRHPLRYDTGPGRGSASGGRARRGDGEGGRLVPPAPAHRPRRGAARGYLRTRGYDGDVVRPFQIGWAPDEWDAPVPSLRLPADVLADTGLGSVKAGRQQDAFRARIMFPIFDARGDAVAFGGRILPGADGPKYKNSPETHALRQEPDLYGLNWAKAEIVTAGEAVVCEGYTDVIGLARGGPAPGGRHLRHGADRRPRARPEALRPPARARLRRRRRRPGRGRAVLRVGAALRGRPRGGRPPRRRRPRRPGPTDPDALRTAVDDARPFLAFRLDRAARRRPTCARPRAGPGRPRRRWRWSASTPTSSSATST